MEVVMKIGKVGVLGFGLMGSGIVQVSADSGYETIVREVNQKFIDKGFKQIENLLQRNVKKSQITQDRKESILKRISGTTKIDDLKDCDLIIEAVTEDIQIKKELFKELDQICKKDCILASNTSSLVITEMAVVTARPEKFVGLHFFNPVPVMKLVEVVKTLFTDTETFSAACNFIKSLGKVVIAAKDTSGFLVNRLLNPYLLDAIRALEEGWASVEDIDNAMKLACGYPMGPLTLLDFVGLDTVYRASCVYYEEYKDKKYAPPPLLKKMVLAGYHGRKTGKGFYEYTVDPPRVSQLTI
jgi:3-hydroxybutyryl-CoA dehydrogenase